MERRSSSHTRERIAIDVWFYPEGAKLPEFRTFLAPVEAGEAKRFAMSIGGGDERAARQTFSVLTLDRECWPRDEPAPAAPAARRVAQWGRACARVARRALAKRLRRLAGKLHRMFSKLYHVT